MKEAKRRIQTAIVYMTGKASNQSIWTTIQNWKYREKLKSNYELKLLKVLAKLKVNGIF